ncbi:hypothetical protein [Nonomuraea jiangxiensis]|nr:hypothetical protein [Nonomuraea jiangxiensis]
MMTSSVMSWSRSRSVEGLPSGQVAIRAAAIAAMSSWGPAP